MLHKRPMQGYFHRWLSRRLPPGQRQRLDHRRIFILPSGFGMLWLGLAVLLFLFGTNYQNNLIIALGFLLSSVFVSSIFYSYRNLAGLALHAQPAPEAFAGDNIQVTVKLLTDCPRYQLQLQYPATDGTITHEITAPGANLSLPVSCGRRGWLHPGRLLLESRFPLGLCRVWSWIDLDNPVLVYPPLHPAPLQLQGIMDSNQQQLPSQQPGIEEFSGLKSWHPGESLKQVAWKQYAQGRGMLAKEFNAPQGAPVWLQLPPGLQGATLEDALAKLCWQVLQLARQNAVWGLQLPTQQLLPATGATHRRQCLQALALYGLPARRCDDQP
ncbi:DUF58 domain-containing protein [Shewanella sp. YIC-542]|uniref:DUF58 domain-containing protein n=1 Tax=Shewanella mytili TaxID=3377111 RepID=UPI00398F35F4